MRWRVQAHIIDPATGGRLGSYQAATFRSRWAARRLERRLWNDGGGQVYVELTRVAA